MVIVKLTAVALFVALVTALACATSHHEGRGSKGHEATAWIPGPDDPRRYSLDAWPATHLFELRSSEARTGDRVVRVYAKHTVCAAFPSLYPHFTRGSDFVAGTAEVARDDVTRLFPLDEKIVLADRNESGSPPPSRVVIVGSAALPEATSSAAAHALGLKRAETIAARMREQHGHRYLVVARSLGWDGFAYLDPDTALVGNGTVLFFDEVPRDKLSRIVVREPLAPEVVDEMRTQLRVAVTEAKAGPCWALIKHGTSWTFSAGADQLRVKLPCEEDAATSRLETLIDRSWTACGW